MRGWVGVEKQDFKKMAESQIGQAFQTIVYSQPSAHLTQTRFQPFPPFAFSFSRATIRSSAQPNLENYIFKAFQTPAVEIKSNPY